MPTRSSTTSKKVTVRKSTKKASAKKAARKRTKTKKVSIAERQNKIAKAAKKISTTGTVKRNPLGHLLMEKMMREAGFRGGISSDKKLLDAYSTDESIFKHPLQKHLWQLQQHPRLCDAFKAVLSQTGLVRIGQEESFKLHSMGLVMIEGNRVQVSCDLYLRYFQTHLAVGTVASV